MRWAPNDHRRGAKHREVLGTGGTHSLPQGEQCAGPPPAPITPRVQIMRHDPLIVFHTTPHQSNALLAPNHPRHVCPRPHPLLYH